MAYLQDEDVNKCPSNAWRILLEFRTDALRPLERAHALISTLSISQRRNFNRSTAIIKTKWTDLIQILGCQGLEYTAKIVTRAKDTCTVQAKNI